MHLLPAETVTLDETATAAAHGLSPADILLLSFTDSDLASVAAAHEAEVGGPTLACASLARLRHPMSVDLLVEEIAARARVIVVRLLGGADYWRYGVDELAALARARGIWLAIVPGDTVDDPRLATASTAAASELSLVSQWFGHGGPDNMASLAGFLRRQAGGAGTWSEPRPLPALGRLEAACRDRGDSPRALIVGYRSLVVAGDVAPFVAISNALSEKGFSVDCVYVTSLKDTAVVAPLAARLAALPPDVIINTTAFSARLDGGGTVLDRAGAPVLQAVLSIGRREAWAEARRGLSAADLAMNVVLPEVDGRIPGPAVAFKAEVAARGQAQYARVELVPDEDGIGLLAERAAAWARLRRIPNGNKLISLVIPDYPGRMGRGGRAVGLDTAGSVAAIAKALAENGYSVRDLPEPDRLMRALEEAALPGPSVAEYAAAFASLPKALRDEVVDRWGAPEAVAAEGGRFRFQAIRAGGLIVALQPDRATRAEHMQSYHDPSCAPAHAYICFHLWLRGLCGTIRADDAAADGPARGVDALVQLGTHGTLEWLPGKAVALSPACAPAALTGAMPVLYPFIVNNPGEAAHARRRIGAVTIGHLTPPLMEAGSFGAAAELEPLMDEYAAARALDGRRARLVARAVLDKAFETGLAEEAGVSPNMDEDGALTRLDAWLCDLKEMRIGDGLHVFGRSPQGIQRDHALAGLPEAAAASLDACGPDEIAGLLAGLAGRFVPPGPAGAPQAGRADVLPTGRNLYAVDPRGVPTPTAYEIGRGLAAEVMIRHAQDHGDWPRSLVIDLWGSATMRTGGEDLAQAFALIGVRPDWDPATGRVTGFTVLPAARLERPRVDVTLRVSGLFRDVFADQIELFDRAVQEVARRDEPADFNPLIGALAADRASPPARLTRVFGTAPGAYGVGLSSRINADDWNGRDELGAHYLAASSHAYGGGLTGEARPDAFAERVRAADALVHVEDLAGRDVLDFDAFAEHEGGFSAAAASLGNTPALYHGDTSRPGAIRIRSLPEEVARVVRARATNPAWIAGQMRHGHRGAAEIAETVDNLYALGVTARVTRDDQFARLFDATLGDEAVRAFLAETNPRAARGMALTFLRAQARGLWHDRRNSTAALLADLAREAS